MSTSLPKGSATALLIADSNRMQSQLLTGALRRRPEFQVSSCMFDVDSILAALVSKPAEIVLLSVSRDLAVESQLSAVRRVHVANPALAKILLTESYDREFVIAAFRAGARGIFCLAETQFRMLCRCIQKVADGQIWINTEQLNFLLELIAETPSIRVTNSRGVQMLTPREEQVVALVAASLSNRDIARELNLSEHTVKKYVFRIFDKLGISSRVELALYAVNQVDSNAAKWISGLKHSPPSA